MGPDHRFGFLDGNCTVLVDTHSMFATAGSSDGRQLVIASTVESRMLDRAINKPNKKSDDVALRYLEGENLMDACLFLQPSIGQHVQLMVCCKQHFNYNLALADVAT